MAEADAVNDGIVVDLFLASFVTDLLTFPAIRLAVRNKLFCRNAIVSLSYSKNKKTNYKTQITLTQTELLVDKC